jgi:hypothetical protein
MKQVGVFFFLSGGTGISTQGFLFAKRPLLIGYFGDEVL